eukprot:TRINITY_DN11450_c0_g1_i1.p1 TRINITY_DN11450_c0_g1~~TRINITY_DN11450_c0_g1_i1.p1  ORF type:complete len:500 (+),score=163.44 TRINITY_DN11450_c0_g1_i1:58-1557(+)
MATNSASSTKINSLDQLKQLQKQAFDFISLGLDLDQMDPMSALGFYSKGVNLLRQAVRMSFSREEREEAKLLQLKMSNNLNQVEDRMRIIESSLNSSNRLDSHPVNTVHPPGFSIGNQNADNNNVNHRVEYASAFIPAHPVYKQPSISPPIVSPPKSVPPARQTTVHNVPNQRTNHQVIHDNHVNVEAEKDRKKKESFEKLKQMDPKIRDIILNEVVMENKGVSWEQVAGLEIAKQALREAAVLPILRPDIFSGLRTPARGILMFGPPGNGKTFLARCIASECNATFFSISASSLTSKYLGDSEKLVRCLFAAAKNLQPSIIFIDEIDSVLGERGGSNEHEASRRLKTEFLVQFDGVNSSSEDQILFIGATNRPQDLDEAVRRRLVKRIYIPLPDEHTRFHLIKNLLSNEKNIQMQQKQMKRLVDLTEGYSGSDLAALCRDAALEPVREQGISIKDIPLDRLRPLSFSDFEKAMKRIRPSVSQQSIAAFEEWNDQFGSS